MGKSRVLAIDPGPTMSAYVAFDARRTEVCEFGKLPNAMMLRAMYDAKYDIAVIEKIASYGMAVGEEVFETCVWTGRFIEAAHQQHEWGRLLRADVKMHLCHSMRATDANIRQALIDRYGGKEKAIGKKKTPGPLYGVSGDCWAALAVAVTWTDKNTGEAA